MVSATSAADEMRREELTLNGYLRRPINSGTTVKYIKGRKSLYLIADGEPANFLHCGSVGPYIHLVQGAPTRGRCSLAPLKSSAMTPRYMASPGFAHTSR